MTPEQYIEELQGDITDLRTELADAHHVLGLTELARRELEAELADWQRHGVKVSVDCETCGGSREIPMREDTQGDFTEPCPDCGGIGKKPRDGVLPMLRGGTPTGKLVFPAEWLGES